MAGVPIVFFFFFLGGGAEKAHTHFVCPALVPFLRYGKKGVSCFSSAIASCNPLGTSCFFWG